MAIHLNCPCGQRLDIPPQLAGRNATCPACGALVSVPAMGVLAGPKARTPAPRPSRTLLLVVLAIPAILLLCMAAAVGAWFLWPRSVEPEPVAVAPPPKVEEKPAPVEKPVERIAPPEVKPEPPPTVVAPEKPQPSIAKEFKPEPAIAKEFKPQPGIAKEFKPLPVVEEKKPKPPAGPFREGDSLYQELLVSQKSICRVQGLPISTALSYQVVSRYTVQKVLPSGALEVKQEVLEAKLLEADDLTRGALAGAVAKLPGATFALKINAKRAVTQLDGNVGKVEFMAGNLLGGQGLQMASLLDRDGWKEMAQATFFRPEPAGADGRWAKPLTHNWGPLGSWAGEARYAPAGKQGDVQRYGYGLHLVYKAPGPGAPALPLPVSGAAFQPQTAGGAILFDVAKGRTVGAEERFHVRGALLMNVLGQNTPVEIEEDQQFKLRVFEK